MILIATSLPAQQTISGFVHDAATFQPLANTSILWKIEKTGTSSDSAGHFILAVSKTQNDTLIVSHINYKPIKIPLHQLKDQAGKSLELLLQPLVRNMQPVVVTATRNKSNLMRIPQKVSIIDSAALHALPMLSIDDAFIYSGGVMADRPMGIFASKSVVSMRGLSGNEQGRVLVLLDGIPVNKSDGGTVNFNLSDPMLTERIEIVKGPSSALYGGNAMGGVIHIISAIPEQKLEGRLKLGYGTYQTLSGHLILQGARPIAGNKSYYWSASAFRRESDGYISEPDYMQTEYTVPVFLKEQMLSFKGGYRAGKSTHIMISALYYDDERGGGEKVYEKLGSYSEHDSYHLKSTFTTVMNGWKMNAAAYFLQENYAKINEYVKSGEYTLYDVDSKRSDMGVIAHANRTIGQHQVLTTGFELKRGAVDAADVYHTSTDRIINAGIMHLAAIFVQDEWSVTKRFTLTTGMRYDYAAFSEGRFSVENPGMNNLYLLQYENNDMPNTAWHSISPKASLHFAPDSVSGMYLSWAHGFRAPILDDLCRSGKTRGGFQVANSELIPEHLNNFELGYRRLIHSKWMVEPLVYFSIGRQFMYPVATGDTVDMGYAAPVIITSNVSEVQIAGAEIEIMYQMNPSVNLFVNYAFAQPVITAYEPASIQQSDLSGLELSNVPDHMANAGFRIKHKMVGFSLNVRYIGRRWINDTNTPDEKYGLPATYEPFITLDAKAYCEIGKHWLFECSLVNAANRIYTDSKGQICPGRMVSLGGSIRF